MDEEKSLKEEIRELKEVMNNSKQVKSKKFKLPIRARVSKAKVKKGYVTVATINENKSLSFSKEPVIDGTIKLNDTFHAIDVRDIFTYKNKPFVWLAKNKLNPFNPLEGQHETYGQKYVMARMESDKIVSKKSIGWGMIIIGLLALGGLAWYAFKK